MTNRKEVYKCELCGNIIEVLHEGAGKLVCCEQPMKLQKENTIDTSNEKHIPIINGKKIVIGSVEHPMEEKHFIEWIEATDENGKITKVFLNPGEKPEVEFEFEPTSTRAYCNLHGLWKSK